MRFNLFWRTLPGYLVLLGLFFVPVYQQMLIRERAYAASADLAKQAALSQHKELSGVPAQIVIPRLYINVGVVSGVYYNNAAVWSVAHDYANYAENTTPANNISGKTYIYGHWTKAIFGNTKNMVPGDIAYVTTSNHHIFTYSYTGNEVIKPTDTGWLNNMGGKPGLILMTCQGLWAQDRRLMFFNLKQAS